MYLHLSGSSGNIIGKSLVVKSGKDDLGKGDDAQSLIDGNSGDGLACCVITALDDSALPIGARCNASKVEPEENRPKCVAGACCGTAMDPTETISYEVCASEEANSVTALGDPAFGLVKSAGEYEFECIEGAKRLVSSIAAIGAAAYLMA